MTTVPTSSTTRQASARVLRLLTELRPAWITDATPRHSTAGYLLLTGHYLGTLHLTALEKANNNPQRAFVPQIGSGTDEVVAHELRSGGLLDRRNKITDDGVFFLVDRGWLT